MNKKNKESRKARKEEKCKLRENCSCLPAFLIK
jgi:hypothetical protein